MHDALVGIARGAAGIMPGVHHPAAAQRQASRGTVLLDARVTVRLGAPARRRGITPRAGDNPPDARVLVRSGRGMKAGGGASARTGAGPAAAIEMVRVEVRDGPSSGSDADLVDVTQ
jgi:hypothetical protein